MLIIFRGSMMGPSDTQKRQPWNHPRVSYLIADGYCCPGHHGCIYWYIWHARSRIKTHPHLLTPLLYFFHTILSIVQGKSHNNTQCTSTVHVAQHSGTFHLTHTNLHFASSFQLSLASDVTTQ